MCGIAGFCGPGDRDDLGRMLAMLVHRGPDGSGIWEDESQRVFLGHRRLAIIDLEWGHQPMATSDNEVVVTYNGEIYNHLELRRELESHGHRFITDHSDTEVLLHGYRQWGYRVVDHLNGMWAFALYDSRNKQFFLSRDRFGEKPLYYTTAKGALAFASELSALIKHSNIVPSISDMALRKYFAHGYIPAPSTLYRGIHKLPAGYCLTYSTTDGSTRQWCYWDYVIEPFDRLPKNPDREWSDELRMLLRRSVNRRLISDVDLGVFLSGGLDSSTIAALGSQESLEPIRTFTLGFEESSFDESEHAEKVAKEVGAKHHTESLSLSKSLGYLDDIIGHLDEPFGDSSLLPTWLLSRLTRRDVKVALSGDGGDELFAGYDPFAALKPARAYHRMIPPSLHATLTRLAGYLPVSHSNISLDFRIKKGLSGLDHPPRLWGPVWMAPLGPSDLNDLFGHKVDPEAVYSEAIAAWESCQSDTFVDRLTQFFVKVYLQDDILTKTDRASMMHGLEVRTPFLDRDVVDFARRIPWQYRYRRGRRKHILKEAATGLIPTSIINRRKKGFGAPVGHWLHQGRFTVASSSTRFGLDRGTLQKFSTAHQNGQADYRLFLWSQLVLERFASRIME